MTPKEFRPTELQKEPELPSGYSSFLSPLPPTNYPQPFSHQEIRCNDSLGHKRALRRNLRTWIFKEMEHLLKQTVFISGSDQVFSNRLKYALSLPAMCRAEIHKKDHIYLPNKKYLDLAIIYSWYLLAYLGDVKTGIANIYH